MEYPMRLNKYLASCALGSRRHVEELVRQGRVAVNGVRVDTPGEQIFPESRVAVDNKVVTPRDPCYVVCYKPRGVVCAVWDRYFPTVLEIFPEALRNLGIFPVGRLDKDSEGLLLLTNDGDFCQAVAHPRSGMTKRYRVRLVPCLSAEALERWRAGVMVAGRWVIPQAVSLCPGGVEITLREGLKREIRVMAQPLGYDVVRLIRVAIGALEWEKLAPGHWITFSREELWCMMRAGGSV